MPTNPAVSIVMGSDSDLEIMREAGKALDDFGIAYEIDVTSAQCCLFIMDAQDDELDMGKRRLQTSHDVDSLCDRKREVRHDQVGLELCSCLY